MTSLISLGTAILGLLLVVPLFVMGIKRPANVWLSLFVYAISSLSLADYCVATGVYLRVPALWGLLDWPLAGIGAFFYCYVRSLVGLGNGWRQGVHFLPLLLLVIMLIKARLFLPDDQLRILVSGPPGLGRGWILLAFQLLVVAYAVGVLVRLHQYRQRLRDNYSSVANRDLVWLQWLTWSLLALLFVWFPAAKAGGLWGIALSLGRIGILYVFAWYGLHHKQVFLPPIPVFQPPESTKPIDGANVTLVGNESQPVGEPKEALVDESAPKKAVRYTRSGMTVAARELIGKRLALRMERDKDYLVNDLTLADLAQRIGTSPQLLSEYLNDALNQKYFDYINGLRIAEVQRQMLDGLDGSGGETLLQLAFRSGFNSKSTFNMAFKKFSGLTPSAWREKQLQAYEPIG